MSNQTLAEPKDVAPLWSVHKRPSHCSRSNPEVLEYDLIEAFGAERWCASAGIDFDLADQPP
jgi:hypothetical protein